MCERTCLQSFHFQKHRLFEWTKVANNVKKASLCKKHFEQFRSLPPRYALSEEQHFLPPDSLHKLPSCGFDIYLSTNWTVTNLGSKSQPATDISQRNLRPLPPSECPWGITGLRHSRVLNTEENKVTTKYIWFEAAKFKRRFVAVEIVA